MSPLGCATPSPIIRLEPHAPSPVWVSGTGVMTAGDEGVRVATAFDHQSDDKTVAVRVEVANDTEAPFEVKPDDLVFVTCASAGTDSCSAGQRPLDPEAALLELESRRSVERANAVNSEAFLGTMLVLSAVGDVASVGSRHPHSGAGTAAVAASLDSSEANHAAALTTLEGRAAALSVEALRRTTLMPGKSVVGDVYLPIDPAASFVWLWVHANGHAFRFGFQQVIRDPRTMAVVKPEPPEPPPHAGRAGM